MTIFQNRQRGVSLILALFIIVVLSMLGAVMIRILLTGAETVAREVISTRAFFAAESGAQRQLNAIFPPGAAMDLSACANANNTPRTNTYTMGGLLACSDVSVSCQYLQVEGTYYFNISSTGRCGPASDQAVRVVDVQAKEG